MSRKLTTPKDILLDTKKLMDNLIEEIEKKLSEIKSTLNKDITVFVYFDYPDEVIDSVCKEYRKAGWSHISYERDSGYYGEEKYFHIEFTFTR